MRRSSSSRARRCPASPRSPIADPSARWIDPAFVAIAHRWLRASAARHGYRVCGEIEQPHVRPWSTVFRVATSRHALFLKCCGQSQAHEPRLTALLAAACPGLVPTLIARHPRRDWMVLADGGRRLRDAVSGTDLLRAWERMLPRCAELQIALIGRERELLAIGVPDHTAPGLVDGIRAVLADRAVMGRRDADHLSADDRRRIRRALPVLRAQAAELDALGIGATIQHDDLHDANVLVRGRRTVLFDWGDACVAHPFLTLMITLRSAARRAGLRESDPAIRRLRDAYLEPFSLFASRRRLRAGAAIGVRLAIASRALTSYRVARSSEGPLEFGDSTFAGWLRLVSRAFAPRT